MQRLLELRRKKTALREQADAVIDKAAAEKRALTPDEEKAADKIIADIQAVKRDEERHIALHPEIAEEARKVEQTRVPSATPGDGAATAPKPFRSLGEQLLAVKDFYTDRGLDKRLTEVRTGPSGLNEGTPSEGGFLVQQDFTAELLKNTYDTNEIPRRCRRIPISGPSNSFSMNVIDETSRATGSRWGGIQVYRVAEAIATTASKPKFAKLEMKLEKMMGLCYATDENLQDATQLGAIISQGFTEEFGFKLSDEIFRGDGAGKCLGILSSPALVTIAKETGQAADTIVTENILKMWKCRKGRNLAWLYNQELEDQLETLTLAIGTGGVEMRLFAPPTVAGGFGTIKGAPAIPVEVASGAGDVGDIVLADLSQYLLIDKGDIQTAESIHVMFLTDESTFRFIYRVNGQPMAKSKITPYKRTDSNFYVSPFVTLAAR
ncbi:MAG: phage major capsid protein [bacterium]